MADEAFLLCVQGAQKGAQFPIPYNTTTIVGRGNQAQIRVADLMISRQHAKLLYYDDTLKLEDLSSNGLFLNNSQARKGGAITLNDGDIIQLGKTKFEVQIFSEEIIVVDDESAADHKSEPALPDTLPLPDPEARARKRDESSRRTPPPEPPSPDAKPGGRKTRRQTVERQKVNDLPKGERDTMVGRQVDKYLIKRLLGEGGMGRVYLAEQKPLNRDVALKSINYDYDLPVNHYERFLRGARVNSQLHHPNIVALYDAGQDNEMYFLSMEYVKGESIGSIIREKGPLPVAQAVDISVQTLLALQYCHDNNVVHRDIKPDNLLLTADGTVKVTDLGIAKALIDKDMTLKRITLEGSALGTPRYMSPEQYDDSVNAGFPTDIYSVGVTLYEMLAGKPPFRTTNPIALARMVLSDPPPLLTDDRPDLPKPLCNAVYRALAKKPDDRFPSASAFADALRPFLDHPNA